MCGVLLPSFRVCWVYFDRQEKCGPLDPWKASPGAFSVQIIPRQPWLHLIWLELEPILILAQELGSFLLPPLPSTPCILQNLTENMMPFLVQCSHSKELPLKGTATLPLGIVSVFLLSPVLCPSNVFLICHRHNCLSSTLSEFYYCFCFHLHLHPTIASMLKPRATVGLSELVPFLLKLYFSIAFSLMFEESCFTNFIKFSGFMCVFGWQTTGLVTTSWLSIKASFLGCLNPLLFSWYPSCK